MTLTTDGTLISGLAREKDKHRTGLKRNDERDDATTRPLMSHI